MATFKKSILDDTPQARTPGTDGHEYSKLKVENKKTEKKRQKKPSDDPKEKKRKIDWDYENPDNFFDINLGEGIGIGSFPRICKPIMDNPIFRRLDNIKQLGAVNYVYPDGNHSRRSHSLGTAHLACKLVKKLQKQKINGIPPMTGSEMLCVVIGALCHDLGHGPFSHLCEEFMIQEDGTLLSHEEMSVLLFEKILNDYPESKACLDLYFEDYHFNLIKQLIDPPKNEQPWNFFVGPEKAFLFAIVNNSISGLDVDKMDYLLRDSKRVGVNGVTSENIDYCFSKAKICEIPSRPLCKKYKWISFPQTNPQVVSIFFERRQYLHEIVYSHRTVGAVSEMLREAIRLSLSEVKLSRGTKIDVPLEHCFRKENLDLYIMLTDEYLRTQILYSTSTSPEIKKAQEILTDISNRKFWRSIVAFKYLDSTIHYPRLEPMEIKAQFRSLDLDFNYNEILVVRKNFNAGKGLNTNPMDLIPFYPGENGESVRYMRFPKPSYQSAIFIIAPFICNEKDAITIDIAIRKYAMKHSLPSPTTLFRNNENFNLG